MQYRRLYIPGGSYFFTLVMKQRRKIFAQDSAVGILKDAFRRVMERRHFTIDAIAILPDHLHCIWTLPPGDQDFSTRWRLIKTWFTKRYDVTLSMNQDTSEINKGRKSVWQHRYWEHLLRDQEDYNHHVNYIHYNPVRHGYVSRAFDWQYSSFRRYVRNGICSENWGNTGMDFPENIGKE